MSSGLSNLFNSIKRTVIRTDQNLASPVATQHRAQAGTTAESHKVSSPKSPEAGKEFIAVEECSSIDENMEQVQLARCVSAALPEDPVQLIYLIFEEAYPVYQDWEPLIRYFEHEIIKVEYQAMGLRSIMNDFKDLEALHQKIQDAKELTPRDLSLLPQLTYLRKLSEDTIFDKYGPAIDAENRSPFNDFTQEHRDAYLRLKLRLLNKRLPPIAFKVDKKLQDGLDYLKWGIDTIASGIEMQKNKIIEELEDKIKRCSTLLSACEIKQTETTSRLNRLQSDLSTLKRDIQNSLNAKAGDIQNVQGSIQAIQERLNKAEVDRESYVQETLQKQKDIFDEEMKQQKYSLSKISDQQTAFSQSLNNLKSDTQAKITQAIQGNMRKTLSRMYRAFKRLKSRELTQINANINSSKEAILLLLDEKITKMKQEAIDKLERDLKILSNLLERTKSEQERKLLLNTRAVMLINRLELKQTRDHFDTEMQSVKETLEQQPKLFELALYQASTTFEQRLNDTNTQIANNVNQINGTIEELQQQLQKSNEGIVEKLMQTYADQAKIQVTGQAQLSEELNEVKQEIKNHKINNEVALEQIQKEYTQAIKQAVSSVQTELITLITNLDNTQQTNSKQLKQDLTNLLNQVNQDLLMSLSTLESDFLTRITQLNQQTSENAQNHTVLANQVENIDKNCYQSLTDIANEFGHLNSKVDKIGQHIINDIDPALLEFKKFQENWLDMLPETHQVMEQEHFRDSLILTEDHMKHYVASLLPGFNTRKSHLSKLYSGNQNSWDPKMFHKLCDGRGPTITLFKCQSGKICGAYTSLPWKSHGKWQRDEKMFLFSVDQRQQYKSQKEGQDVYHCVEHGPYFCSDSLGLSYSPMNRNNGGFCYPIVKGQKESELTGEGAGEVRNRFTCIECEVYQVFV